MDTLQIVLRIIHIVSGVFWVGSIALFVLFLEPTARALGPAFAPVSVHLIRRLKLGTVLAVAGSVTVAAGLILYWRASGGLDPDWITSGTGLGFTVGGSSAILGLSLGVFVLRPVTERLAGIAEGVLSTGSGPTPEQAAQIQELAGRQRRVARLVLLLLLIAVMAMASARYLV